MERKTLLIIAGIAVAGIGFLWWRNKQSQAAEDANTQSQQPAEAAMQYYSVPPNIGAQVNSTGGLNYPQGNTYLNTGQAMPLPMNTTLGGV